jgi:hypothetical protein
MYTAFQTPTHLRHTRPQAVLATKPTSHLLSHFTDHNVAHLVARLLFDFSLALTRVHLFANTRRHLASLPDARVRMQEKVIAVLQTLHSQLENRGTIHTTAGIVEAIDQAIARVPGQVIAADADTDGWEVV